MGKRIDKYLRLQPDVQYRIHIKSMILTNQSCALLLSMARGLQLDTLSARMTIFIYILSHSSLLLAQYNPLSLLIVLGKLSIAFNALLEIITFPTSQIYNSLKQLIQFYHQRFLATKAISLSSSAGPSDNLHNTIALINR